MANFKPLICLLGACMSGCSDDHLPHFFSDISLDERDKFEYQDIHQLSLTLSHLSKEINETGFRPILNCKFHLEDMQHGPWGQAWVAFNISVVLSGTEIVAIKRAGVLQNHSMDIQFQHELPKFGISKDDIRIKIEPVAWMPSYPLNIINNDPNDPDINKKS